MAKRKRKVVPKIIKAHYIGLGDMGTEPHFQLKILEQGQYQTSYIIEIPVADTYGLINGLRLRLKDHREWLGKIAGLFGET